MQQLGHAVGSKWLGSKGSGISVKHFEAIALKRTGHAQGRAVAHAKLHHHAVVKLLTVSRHIEVEQMGISILHGMSHA